MINISMRKMYIIIEETILILTDKLDGNHNSKRIKDKRSRKNKTYKECCILFIIFKRKRFLHIYSFHDSIYFHDGIAENSSILKHKHSLNKTRNRNNQDKPVLSKAIFHLTFFVKLYLQEIVANP